MKEEKNCKIVQDLLPNYIENLTNEETNKFIEDHLKTCDKCKKIYESMKKDIAVDNKGKEKRKVKFLKKYRNKLRILEMIILMILLAFVINTGRKVYIIAELNSKAEEYVNSTNYHKISYSLDEGNYTKTEVFSLEDKKKVIITTVTEEGKKEVITMYGTKTGTLPDTPYAKTYPPIETYRQNVYIENEAGKTAMLNFESGVSVGPQEAFWGLENTKDLIMTAITTSITKTTYDGKECYYVSGSSYILPNASIYVDEDTGLLVSTMASETESADGTIERIAGAEYEYEFGTVTEEVFIEPDVSEYKIVEQ